MRLLLVFLAMLTGLSLPQAAVAAARAQVADVGLAASVPDAAETAREACPVRARAFAPPRKFAASQRFAGWLPIAMQVAGCAYELTDRARR